MIMLGQKKKILNMNDIIRSVVLAEFCPRAVVPTELLIQF